MIRLYFMPLCRSDVQSQVPRSDDLLVHKIRLRLLVMLRDCKLGDLNDLWVQWIDRKLARRVERPATFHDGDQRE
ncbi:hypothetical protein Bca4012_101401 [Brassica carinata]